MEKKSRRRWYVYKYTQIRQHHIWTQKEAAADSILDYDMRFLKGGNKAKGGISRILLSVMYFVT